MSWFQSKPWDALTHVIYYGLLLVVIVLFRVQEHSVEGGGSVRRSGVDSYQSRRAVGIADVDDGVFAPRYR